MVTNGIDNEEVEIKDLNTVSLYGVCNAGNDVLRKFIVLFVAVNEAFNPSVCYKALSGVLCVVLRK